MAAESQRWLSYCAEQVRSQDYERYLCCLFAPAARREALFALHAFNMEIARTREVVSDPMLGQIRLQWWRDSIAGLYDDQPPPTHYVLEPLAEAVERYGLAQDAFETMLAAREADLDQDPPRDVPALVSYAERTAVPLIQLSLSVLEAGESPAAQTAARHTGIAYALTGLLRAVAFHARGRRQYLPEETVNRAGLSRRDLFELRPNAALADAVREIAGEARRHLDAARQQHRDVPPAALPALLPARVADSHLRRLARLHHDVFDARVQRPHPFLPLTLAWAAQRRRY